VRNRVVALEDLLLRIQEMAEEERPGYDAYMELASIAKDAGQKELAKKLKEFALDELKHYDYLETVLSISRLR